jgi:hypothetical protein
MAAGSTRNKAERSTFATPLKDILSRVRRRKEDLEDWVASCAVAADITTIFN